MSLMSTVRRPFVIRVQHDDPHVARSIARALVPMLRARNARVLLDGEPMGAGAAPGEAFGVHVLTGGRVLPGTTVTIGVHDEEHGPRWLTPLPVSEEPLTASDQVMAFLEEWGFVGAPSAPATRAVATT